MLIYEPDPKRLKANYEGKQAQTEGEDTERLLAKIDPRIAEKLKDKRRLVVDLQVRQEGNWLKIEAIIPKG